MRYLLESYTEKIESPVLCRFDGEEISFANGAELSQHYFEKNYMIRSLRAVAGTVILDLAENRANEVDFRSDEQISFF